MQFCKCATLKEKQQILVLQKLEATSATVNVLDNGTNLVLLYSFYIQSNPVMLAGLFVGGIPKQHGNINGNVLLDVNSTLHCKTHQLWHVV